MLGPGQGRHRLDRMPTVLITRPQPQADRLAQDLAGQGIRTLVSPLMRTEFPAVVLPEGWFSALILTSEAGAQAVGQLRPGLPPRAFCVGERTAAVARAKGLDAISLGNTADQLLVALRTETGPFLYLRGQQVSADISAILSARGQPAAEAVVYAQHPQNLTADARALLARPGPVVLPLYSARSAGLFLAACPPDIRATLHPCLIAPAVLDALPEPLKRQAVVADNPGGPAMQAAILRVIRSLVP